MDTAASAFARATLYTDDTLYTLIHLPAPAITPAAATLAEVGNPFSALIVDKDEVTLVLAEEDWQDFQHRLPDRREAGGYRLITFDVPMDLNVIGFMALISGILAEAQIPIMAFSSFERDHLLIQSAQFQAAWDALHAAQARLAAR
jgi:hypothetical protein